MHRSLVTGPGRCLPERSYGLLWTRALSYDLCGSQQSRAGLCLTQIKEGMSSDGDTQLVVAGAARPGFV